MSNAAISMTEQTPTTELVLLSSKPASIQFNLQEFREGIRTELKKYDLVVTVDTVKDAKTLAADLNGKAKSLKDRFKESAAIVTKPVDDLGLEVAEIVAEILESREKLTAQIKKFESERKLIVEKVLKDKRLALWEEQGIQEEFRDADIAKLIKLTAFTAKDSLTSATLRDLQVLIDSNRRLQDQTEKRLLLLENQSYKQGLSAPLTRDHVNSFLFADNDRYAANLESMMSSELTRQAATEAVTRKKIADEQAREAEQKQAIEQTEPNIQTNVLQERTQQAQGGEHSGMKQQLHEMKMPTQENDSQIDFILTPIDRVGTLVARLTTTHDQIVEEALKESVRLTTMIDVWTKDQGRVAIADGESGRVFVWNQL